MSVDAAFIGKKVLITGGLGFIGSNLAHRLVELEADVMVVDSLIPDYGGNLFNIHAIRDRIRVNIADVRDIHAMRYLIQGHDYLFNLAGQVSHIDSMTDPLTDLDINVRSQLTLVESCRLYNPQIRIIHVSTRQQYGRPHYLPVDEKHPIHPIDVNGVHKAAGEMYFILYHEIYGLRSVSVRLTNTYGPRQLIAHNRQGFIGWFIRKILLDEDIQLFGDGQQLRDMCYVDDAVSALLLVAARDEAIGKIYNVGGPEPVSLKQIIETLIEISGKGRYTLVPFPPERKSIDIGDYYTDFSKIHTELGWSPQIHLREGLAQTMSFYEQYRDYYL